MRKCFRPPKVTYFLFYVVWVWTIFLLGPWMFALLSSALKEGIFSYEIVSAALFSFFIYTWFEVWRNLEMRIILTNDAIIFQKPFQSREIPWYAIEEIGAYRPRYARFPWWTVYLKARSYGGKKWKIQPSRFQGGKELVEMLLENSPHAKRLKFVNDSWIPFFSKTQVLEWDKREDVGFLLE